MSRSAPRIDDRSRIFYYHWKKQAARDPCNEMTGFTRLLHAPARDDLPMQTYLAKELGAGDHKGFIVLNRPNAFVQMLNDPKWKELVTEEYVYIAETDHLLRKHLPNDATPTTPVGQFFHYMNYEATPKHVPALLPYMEGKEPSLLKPVGPSPVLIHVDQLRLVAPKWRSISLAMKKDAACDKAFGWVLEMWGWTVAATVNGVVHAVRGPDERDLLQIEPASVWGQDGLSSPILHYTFGVEYNLDGTPVVGGKGAWSLDKRNYYGQAPDPTPALLPL